ncbi:MAG TPA: GNAT family N-acetyltransferase [Candidatus Limnocylindria bacterium]|nr:GNAT family N-acetyltransferase [Candidatus Limnocylindria bacterium]
MPTTTTPSVTLRRGALSFRLATLDDAAFASDVATAMRPDEPEDPASWRHWWATDDPTWTNERFIVLRGEAPIGFARHNHAPWDQMKKRYGRLGFELLPAERTDAQLATVFDVIEERAHGSGTRIFAAYAREDDQWLMNWFARRGYREERRSRAWELDLVGRRRAIEQMAAESRKRMRAEGIVIRTIDQDDDPEKLHKIHEMSEEAASDVPTTIPHVRQSFEVFARWFDAPTVRLDRMWIARDGDDIVGISVLSYPPTRGNVWTDWTGTARKVRGRGVARALKLETVMQAIALGVPRVRTENDGQNAPILHLNEQMGYMRIPGWVQYLRTAGEKGTATSG